jgi:hypothetical protein
MLLRMILSDEEEMAEGKVPRRLAENLNLEKRQKKVNAAWFGTDLVTVVWNAMLVGCHCFRVQRVLGVYQVSLYR